MKSTHPKRFGKYEVRSVLGRGAMGVVYEGFDPDIKRSVAIKVLHPHLLETAEGKAHAERFRREAQAAAQCHHPNIVTVYELGHENGAEFIVMEYAQGEELKYFLDDGHRFTHDEAIHITSEVLRGLSAAHRRGIVHRDIKPANIILMDDGSVKLADFGVARTLDSELTFAGNMVGTPSYMCPEGLRGETVDHRADLYSIGMVLFEMMTGRKPDPQSLYSRPIDVFVDEVLGSLPTGTLPPGMGSILRQALHASPEARFSDTDAFLEALQSIEEVDHQTAATILSETVIAQRPLIPPPPPEDAEIALSEQTIQQLEQGLASHIGPVAGMLVQRGTADNLPPQQLVKELAAHITDAAERRQFLSKAHNSIAAECSLSTPANGTARHDQPAHDTLIGRLDENEISQIGRALAHHLGPIATALVRREAARVNSWDDLTAQLASRIEDDDARIAFLAALESGRRH